MVKRRIIIVGAGLSGLSAAWHLQKKGVDCHIFEREAQIGGLCRSKSIDGFCFDYSGHLLHFKSRYAFNLVKSLLGGNLAEHQRSAWIYISKRYIPYPFQANLYKMPEKARRECLSGLIKASNKHGQTDNKQDNNFLNWIVRTFGKGIARHFLIPYNAKFWTVAPEHMTCDWLDGFIPVPSLNQILKGAVKYSKGEYGYNARFWYPRNSGIVSLPNALAGEIKNIHTGCEVKKIDLRKKEIVLSAGRSEKFDYLISTLPLPDICRIIVNVPGYIRSLSDKLRWNSILNLNLGVNETRGDGRHWIYFPQKEFCFFRVGCFHNFSPILAPADKKSFYIELAFPKDRVFDKKKIIPRIKKDLLKTGILNLKSGACVQDLNFIKYGYPIYDYNYQYSREGILGYLKDNDILACGRYGSWRYLSMEGAILDGKETAEKLLHGSKKI